MSTKFQLAVVAVSLVLPSLAQPSIARADGFATEVSPGSTASARDARDDVPQLNYAYSAFGSDPMRFGALGFGAVSGGARSPADAGGGARMWGSPIERLTLQVNAQRLLNGEGEFAPSASAMVRILGSRAAGWALSALGTYKAEGFDSLGGEAELGFLGSAASHGWHADLNTILGTGLEGGELDGEARARAGYDLTKWFRLGADGQVRYRMAGDTRLVGGRTWDAVLGPQAVVGVGHFFGALSGGPTTMGIASGVGWTAVATVGGGSF